MGNSLSTKDKEKKFLIECIELYRNLPALWQVSSKLYHDKRKRNKAYDTLLAKYKKMFPLATKEDLKKIINILRTNYRKELKKHMSFIKSGGSKFVPSLWCYKEMHFLKDYELKAETSLKHIDKNTKAGGEAGKEEKKHASRTSTKLNQDSTPHKISSHRTSEHAPKIESKTTNEGKNDRLIDLAYNCLTEVKDDYHNWGMVCAADLRKMDQTQQLYAKKAIAEILVEGQLGLLRHNCVKITQRSPFSSTVVKLNSSP